MLSTLGWVGAVATVVAYALVSRRRMSAHSTRFHSINVVGGTLLALSAIAHASWASAASNGVWVLIGAQTILSEVNLQVALRQHADSPGVA